MVEVEVEDGMTYESNLLDANIVETRKRQRMDRGDGKDIIDDDSSVNDLTHTARSRPPNSEANCTKLSHLGSEPKQIRRKKLSKIHAFSGKPPLDSNFYIELLSRVKVPLSVLEIAQISPEAALHWKRLMTRENSRKKKTTGIDGNAVEIEEDLLNELYDYLKNRAESNKVIVLNIRDGKITLKLVISEIGNKQIGSGKVGQTKYC
ncbi:hypothetical protein EV44_g3254 [Erysiphe necator]|uniref:Uncharacterized protein n=1 Tax=Uncinula necator TaxID=52586 RepID=A0A0B1P164_UNCNE|nr:hypothetical protein EV44_g3254 [Erysiphe necator]